MWFRRDLRLSDHPALSAASAEGRVVALYVLDPAFERVGAARRDELARALAELDRDLDGALVLRRGDPREVVPAVAAEAGAAAVYVTRDAGPYGRRRDGVISSRLRADGRALRGVGWPYAVAPGTLTTTAGGPYRVFTPFRRAWRAACWRSPEAAATARWHRLPSDPLPGSSDELRRVTTVGERAAHARWEEFSSSALARYRHDRHRPGEDGTSRLSSALRWGALHPRQVLADLPDDTDAATFASELCWREFYADVLRHQPEAAWRPLDRRFEAMAVDTDARARAHFARWRAGTTGYPLVDAGMRQLATTGWMHNRVRMVTASFLVKDLHLPWQWGALHFLDHLVDGDLASNNLGWQWVAGTGTDAAPFHRVLNPTLQLERFDPDGTYVREWIPELRDVDGPGLRRETTAGIDGYPPRLVDHATERAEALARFGALRKDPNG